MASQYRELRRTTAEICWRVYGTPANFNTFRVLAALLHGTLVVGVSQTLRHWTEAPPIFGRAAIMLGIGPHSSIILEFYCLFNVLWEWSANGESCSWSYSSVAVDLLLVDSLWTTKTTMMTMLMTLAFSDRSHVSGSVHLYENLICEEKTCSRWMTLKITQGHQNGAIQ